MKKFVTSLSRFLVLTLAISISFLSSSYGQGVDDDDEEIEVELSGTVKQVACPTIKVRTSSGRIVVNTTDEDGEVAEIDDEALDKEISCNDLSVGDRVEIKGEFDASTRKVTADEVAVNGDEDACEEDEIEVLELSGTVKQVACPTIKVRTSSGRIIVNTLDEDGEVAEIDDEALDQEISCNDLSVGDKVDVKEGELDASTWEVTADEMDVNADADVCEVDTRQRSAK